MMGARSQIEKKIIAKQQEIADLEIKIRAANSYVQAMQEVLRLLPKEETENGDGEQPLQLRHGSAVAQAKDVLAKVGRPMHVTEILKGIGRENTKSQRVSLSGSLRTYARRNQIFSQEGGNLFGLKEWNSHNTVRTEPPPGFGLDDAEDAAA
jgi:hypothetical protein